MKVDNQVKIIAPLKDTRWDKFVHNHTEGSVFHLSNWAEVIIKTYNFRPFYLISEDASGNIDSGLPLFLVDNGILGKKLISIPFTDYVNPLISSENDYQQLLEKILEFYHKNKYKSIEIRGDIINNNIFLEPDISFKNFILNLQGKLKSDVWNNLHNSVKRGIKKAQKHDIKIITSNDLNAVKIFYDMNVITRKKHGVFPQPYNFYLNLWECIIQKELGFVMLANLNGAPISSAIFLHYNGTIYYKYGASYTEYLGYRPNNLLFWEAINWGLKNNFKYFDFGRVSQDNKGLMQFKRHWGANEFDLPYYYYPEVKGISSMKQSSLKYKIVTDILKKSHPRILEFLGDRFYRYFT